MIKLIAIDIDGTLLKSDRKIHPENLRAVREARDAGVQIVLATGRIRPSMEPFVQELGLRPGPRVCCNGAEIVGVDGETLHAEKLDDGVRDRVSEFAQANGLHLNVYLADRLLFTTDDAWGGMYQRRTKIPVPEYVSFAELASIPVLKLMLIAEPEQLVKVNPLLKERLYGLPVRITESEPEYLEFLAPSADKGSSLSKLCDHLGVQRHEVGAIGDYLNDLEMIQWAGIGCAIGNGAAELKAVADVIAPSNNEGGVAWFIRRLLREPAGSDS